MPKSLNRRGGERDQEDPSATPFAVIIPAHNEARVIGQTLRSILAGAPDGKEPEIIVVPNGCTDDTAEEARRAAPRATVIELTEGAKAPAINAGLKRSSTYPVIIVDADVQISFASLSALAQVLNEPGVMAASPAASIDLEGSDRFVRAFYRVWAAHDYLNSGIGGSGVYGLSREGAGRLGALPHVIADDTFVRRSFPPAQQRRVALDSEGRPVDARVRAPRRILNLVKCEARWHAGNKQLRAIQSDAQGTVNGGQRRSGTRAPLTDVAVYVAVKLAGRALYAYNRLLGRAGAWHRDTSHR